MINPSNQTITLSDGRVLGYQVLGDPSGKPLFFFHGTPGSRFCLTAADAIANVPNLRLILPERPGYGLSTKKPSRTISGWVNDVIELADTLDIETFCVSGSSGGGPYALACGAALPTRVSRILLFNTASPLDDKNAAAGMSIGNRVGLWTAKNTPWLLNVLIKMAARSFEKNPESNLKSLEKQLPLADAKV